MQFENLKMPPYNTTLMGVAKGALDYYGIDISTPSLFGGCGHAFLINIHKQICASGPYCWEYTPMLPLLKNLGLQLTILGCFDGLDHQDGRAAVEEKLRAAMSNGIVCALANMENQLITGFDDTGFSVAQPWCCEGCSPPSRLTFGTWEEFGYQEHACFFTLEKAEPVDERAMILASLNYALDLYANPKEHSLAGYGVAGEAYDRWIGAAPEHGSSHGNWWNGMVWSECRKMASEYFGEIAHKYAAVAMEATDLSVRFAAISEALKQIGDKELAAPQKISLLKKTKKLEAEAIGKVAALAELLRAD